MELDALDEKLTEAFEGRCVRKDLVQRLKKGTNIPTFVLEFLLALVFLAEEELAVQVVLEAQVGVEVEGAQIPAQILIRVDGATTTPVEEVGDDLTAPAGRTGLAPVERSVVRWGGPAEIVQPELMVVVLAAAGIGEHVISLD